MPNADDLRDVLSARAAIAATATGLEPGLDDVRRRVRFRRRRTTAILATASVLAIIGVSTAILTTDSDLPVRTDETPVNWGTSPFGGSPGDGVVTARRTLTDGATIEASALASDRFGPFRRSTWWQAPAECPATVVVRSTTPGATPDQPSHRLATWTDLSRSGSGSAVRLAIPVSFGEMQPPLVVVTRTIVLAAEPVAGATYRLVADGTVIDESVAEGPLLMLADDRPFDDHVANIVPNATQIDLRVEQIDADGAVVAEREVPPMESNLAERSSASTCTPEVDPALWGPSAGTGAAPADPEAAEAAVTALVVGISDLRGPTGSLPGDAHLTADLGEAHWVSPTEAWVRFEVGPDQSEPMPVLPPSLMRSIWVNARFEDGAWALSDATECAIRYELLGQVCDARPHR